MSLSWKRTADLEQIPRAFWLYDGDAMVIGLLRLQDVTRLAELSDVEAVSWEPRTGAKAGWDRFILAGDDEGDVVVAQLDLHAENPLAYGHSGEALPPAEDGPFRLPLPPFPAKPQA